MVEEAIKHTKRKSGIPEPTLKRLPLYLHYLKDALKKGTMNISAPVIGKDLQCDPTQVVKDIAVTGIKGKPKVGYNAYELIHTIESYLGFNKNNEAFLVGAGNLGSALMSYEQLQGFGLKIVAAFDVHPDKIGTQQGKINVIPVSKLPDLTKRLNIRIAILTTPGEVAQQVAEDLVSWGIKAIWNFTPVYLKVPDHIIVQNTSMYSNVAVLLKRLHSSEDTYIA
jgi:redox-sensing transcriptional repressor